ncbi:MAG: VPLPA-CTERM sorting domain-containing protein [Pseudomonadota bacterium]
MLRDSRLSHLCLAGVGAVLAGLLAAPASAERLGVITLDQPLISATGDVGFFAPLSDFQVLASPGTATVPSDPTAVTLGLSVLIDASGALGPQGGALNVFETAGGTSFLTGSALDVGFAFDANGEDIIEVLIGSLGGSAAGAFGPTALATITGEFGDDVGAFAGPIGFFTPGSSIDVRPVGVIPLPAPALLLMTGLGALALARRRR